MIRFEQFSRHLEVLKRAHQEDLQNEFIISGIIDKFFIQFELGWKVLKELLVYEGRSEGRTGSPREIIKAAYACFDFMDETIWLEMLQERNNTTHMYNEEAAKELVDHILNCYIAEFERMRNAVMEQYGSTVRE
ncbi:MAG: nucleotidyltransferase substrate binding protein [Lachnospiraceae bacterium]|nr:nucleotidyltransferase substrate binding protein [Lachnospiraceae bacterium]